jgi:hypothetical protein
MDAVGFNLDQVPFSMRGSWLSISRIVGLHRRAEFVHLVSHQTGMHPILEFQPLGDGAVLTALPDATAERLRWESADGFIEVVFSDAQTVRVRGRGLALRLADVAANLTSFTGSYLYRSPIDGSMVLTSYETGRRYHLVAQGGQLTSVGVELLGEGVRAVVVACDGGEWDLLISEATSVGAPSEDLRPFEEVMAARAAEFAEFADAVAPWREDDPTASLAAYVLWSAVVRPGGFMTRDAVLMSKHWMDKVWSWDHCFNALALAASHPDLALDQFLLLFDHQSEDGALPDSVTHSEVLYNFVKPPVHGWAFTELRRRLPGPIPVEALSVIYERLSAWSRFWLDHRRAAGSALPFYEHGNDSGWDNSTVFDLDRVIESPDLAAFLVLQLEALAEVAAEIAPADVEMWRAEARAIATAMAECLWDGKRMFARSAALHRPAASTSLLTTLPLLAAEAIPSEAIPSLIEKVRAHLTAHGLATELVDSPNYESDGYWRGPIWAPSTVIVEAGLRSVGETALADEVAESFLRLCARSGFAENFDALTGEGLRDRAYTWTASAYLLLAVRRLRSTRP